MSFSLEYCWVWKYFEQTEAKAMAGCKHCGIYFRCTKTSDLYRHFMDHHWYNLRYDAKMKRCFGKTDPNRIWVLNQFSEYIHVALCKCCKDAVNYRYDNELANHLAEHNIDEYNPDDTIIGSELKSKIIEIPHASTEMKDFFFKKYIKAIKKNGQPLRCYDNCKLHDKDKLPFKVTVVRRYVTETDKKPDDDLDSILFYDESEEEVVPTSPCLDIDFLTI